MRPLPLAILLKRPALFRITLPLAGSFLLAAVTLAAFAGFSAAREDKATLASEQLIVRSLIERQQSDLGHTLSAYSNWNEAYEKLRAPVDRAWIQDNYGPETIAVQGVDGAYILGEHEHCLYAVSDRKQRGFDVAQISPGLTALAHQLRSAHQRDWKGFETGLIRRDGHPRLVAAAFLTPSQDELYRPGDPGLVIIFERAIDDALIHDLGRTFNIQGLDQTLGPGEHAALFLDPLGAPAASLSWVPDKPGTRALSEHVPAAIIILAVLAIANLHVLSTWLGMQDAMKRSEAAAIAAKEASRLKSVVLANLSHELRTPLNAIIGFSGVIASEADGAGALERCRAHARYIETGGRDLLTVLNKLLELARIDRGEKEIAVTAVCAEEIITAAGEAMRAKAEAAGLRFRIEAKPALPDVLCDAAATRQILHHLLDNALKFTPAGGMVSLSAEASAEPRVIRFTVSDTGVGIDPERLPALGSAFAIGDEAYSRQHGGMGLGLAIARHLAELQSGRLDLASEKGQGTRATLSLAADLSVQRGARPVLQPSAA